MPDTQEIRNIRRRLERWELAHLRALAASLDAQLDAATARAEAAEASAAMWRHNTDVLQEELLNLASESGAAIGLTQEGHVVAIKPSEATPLPAIGQHLPDLQGSYAGIAGDVEGGAPGHLIVLDDAPSECLRSSRPTTLGFSTSTMAASSAAARASRPVPELSADCPFSTSILWIERAA